jgi:hypothetical protein
MPPRDPNDDDDEDEEEEEKEDRRYLEPMNYPFEAPSCRCAGTQPRLWARPASLALLPEHEGTLDSISPAAAAKWETGTARAKWVARSGASACHIMKNVSSGLRHL